MSYLCKIHGNLIREDNKKYYAFAYASDPYRKNFRIPKSQVIKCYEDILDGDIWYELSISTWFWNKSKILPFLRSNEEFGRAIICGQTLFDVDWEYVILRRQNKKNCFLCGSIFNELQKSKEHLISKVILKAYGYNDGLPNNVVPCCKDCNNEKGGLNLIDYRAFVKRMILEGKGDKYRHILFVLDKLMIKK